MLKERKTEISFVNVLLCLLVIFIHVTSEPVTSLDKMSLQFAVVAVPWKLSAFVVQGFIFLSGLKFFMTDTENINYTGYYVSRIKAIILPYILWVVIYYLYFISQGYFGFDLVKLIECILLGNLVSHFYFIVIIVQFYALMPLWVRLVKRVHPVILLLTGLMVTVLFNKYFTTLLNFFDSSYFFPYNDRLFTTYIFYWLAGCVAGKHYDEFKSLLHKNRAFIITVFVTSAAANAVFSYINLSGRANIYWLEDLHTLYCIFAIMTVFIIGRFYAEKIRHGEKLLKAVDSVTYPIYLCHILIITVLNLYLTKAGIYSVGKRYIIRIFTVYLLAIGLCVLYKKLKNRIVKALKE